MDEKRELRREINRLLAIIVLWAMSFTGFGAGIELDPNTQQNANINTAPNGVPVINISTPGRQGTSVNTFREFNVAEDLKYLTIQELDVDTFQE